jgi:hypothetical protein
LKVTEARICTVLRRVFEAAIPVHGCVFDRSLRIVVMIMIVSVVMIMIIVAVQLLFTFVDRASDFVGYTVALFINPTRSGADLLLKVLVSTVDVALRAVEAALATAALLRLARLRRLVVAACERRTEREGEHRDRGRDACAGVPWAGVVHGAEHSSRGFGRHGRAAGRRALDVRQDGMLPFGP